MEQILYLYEWNNENNRESLPIWQFEHREEGTYRLLLAGISTACLQQLERMKNDWEQTEMCVPEKGFGRRKALKRVRNSRIALEAYLAEGIRSLIARAGKPNNCSYVCESRLKSSYFYRRWQYASPYWELRKSDYANAPWTEELMRQVSVLPHYLLLGNSPDVKRFITVRANRIKSLYWYLSEQELTEDVVDFLTELEEEFGLMTDVRVLPEKAAYETTSLMASQPVTVLDFTGREKTKPGALPIGSIYLDFCSVDTKKLLFADKGYRIPYYSLKMFLSPKKPPNLNEKQA